MNKKNINQFIETAEANILIQFNDLKKRNIILGNKKTSVTLEPLFWELLHNVADDHDCHINDLCSHINDKKNARASLASAIRVFVMSYLEVKHRNSQKR